MLLLYYFLINFRATSRVLFRYLQIVGTGPTGAGEIHPVGAGGTCRWTAATTMAPPRTGLSVCREWSCPTRSTRRWTRASSRWTNAGRGALPTAPAWRMPLKMCKGEAMMMAPDASCGLKTSLTYATWMEDRPCTYGRLGPHLVWTLAKAIYI